MTLVIQKKSTRRSKEVEDDGTDYVPLEIPKEVAPVNEVYEFSRLLTSNVAVDITADGAKEDGGDDVFYGIVY